MVQNGPDGELLLCILKEGSWFGEIALVKDIERTASVRCVTPCVLFRLDKHVFNDCLRKYPQFADQICRATESRVQNLVERTGFLSKPSPAASGRSLVPTRQGSAGDLVHQPGPRWRSVKNMVRANRSFRTLGLRKASNRVAGDAPDSPQSPKSVASSQSATDLGSPSASASHVTLLVTSPEDRGGAR